jgi:CBS domain-containing protein
VNVRDVMTTEVPIAQPEDTLRDAARMMEQRHVKVLPVCDGARLAGVLTDWDVISAIADGGAPDFELVRNYMSVNVVAVTPDTRVEEVGRLVAHRRVHHLVVCEDDRVAGIVHVDVDWSQLGGPEEPHATFAATL